MLNKGLNAPTDSAGTEAAGQSQNKRILGDENKLNQPSVTAGKGFSFHNKSLLGSPIARGIGSEYLTKLVTALGEVFKSADNSVEVTLLTLDNSNDNALAFSAILVVLRRKASPDKACLQLLLVSATGEKIQPIFEQINNNNVEILRVPSDALDAIMWQKARERVLDAFPTVNKIIYADGVQIPSDFNPENKYSVHNLARNSALATLTELEVSHPDFKDINLSEAAGDTSLSINVGFNTQQFEDICGEPFRSDVVMSFVSRRQNNMPRTQSLNSGDRESNIGEASGFIDILYAPPQHVNSNPWIPQQMTTQKYVARLVLTHLTSELALTPAAVLLQLATAAAMRVNYAWIQTFRPIATSSNEIDLRDIGALAIDANLSNDPSGYGQRIDVKSESFTIAMLYDYIKALFNENLLFSIDIPEAGPQTWYLSMFLQASLGDQNAMKRILNAANRLTNGRMAHYFNENDVMFIDTHNRIHMGYWNDRNGNKRDIRDIDLLAVANLSERNPANIKDWSDACTKTEIPMEMRLARRKMLVQSLTNETAVFTGFAHRVTFSGKFMDALITAIQDCGLNITTVTPLSMSELNNQRGVASFAQYGFVTTANSFVHANTGNRLQNSRFQYGPINRFTNGI